MTSNEHRRTADLFHKIRELPAAERPEVLEIECGGNRELLAKLERILAADEQVSKGVFLEGPALHEAARLISPAPDDLPLAGTVLGNYRLGERIGRVAWALSTKRKIYA